MAVTETNRAGVATNVATNVSAAFLANVAPCAMPNITHHTITHSRTPSPPSRTGCVKTFSMNLGPRGIGIAASACRHSDYAETRHLVKHIPATKDGMSPAVLGDGSAACARCLALIYQPSDPLSPAPESRAHRVPSVNP